MIRIDRGIGNFCYRTVQTRGTDTQFVCGSGMNTVLAVSYCARQLGVEALIVVPKATKERICETIRGDGSQLILYGEVKINVYWSNIEQTTDTCQLYRIGLHLKHMQGN